MKPTLALRRQRYELENPLIVLSNLLTCLNVKVSDEYIARIQQHPDYPSLSSLSSALQGWGIETFAAQINTSQLAEISFPAIAHTQKYGGQFLLLTELNGNSITYHDPDSGWMTEDVNEFVQQWTGVVLLVESNEHSGDPNFLTNERKRRTRRIAVQFSMLVLTAAVIALLYATYQAAGVWMTLSMFCFIAGSVVSSLIISAEIGNAWVKSFCTIGKNLDCQSILHSSAATLFGWLKMSDVGLVWFTTASLSVAIALIAGSVTGVFSILATLSFFTVLYVPFSILYQWLAAGKWCSLCLAVQVLLAANAIFLGSTFQIETLSSIKVYDVIEVAGTMAVVVATWIHLKPQFINANQLEAATGDLTAFKLDHELFSMILEKQPSVPVEEYAKEIRIGSLTAPVNITVVLSPFCAACAVAFKELSHLAKQMPDKLNVLIRFSTSNVDNSTSLASHLYSLPQEKMNAALEEWFSLRDFKKWKKIYPADITSEAKQIVDQQQIWLSWTRINKTPTVILNNRKVPAQYKIKDLAYLLANMKFEEALDQEAVR